MVHGRIERMNTTGILLLLVSAICSVSSNILIKQGVTRAGGLAANLRQILAVIMEPAFLGGFLLYVAAATIWFKVLSTDEISSSYPILISFTFTLLTISAMVFLNERVSLQKVLGLVVILAGILITARA